MSIALRICKPASKSPWSSSARRCLFRSWSLKRTYIGWWKRFTLASSLIISSLVGRTGWAEPVRSCCRRDSFELRTYSISEKDAGFRCSWLIFDWPRNSMITGGVSILSTNKVTVQLEHLVMFRYVVFNRIHFNVYFSSAHWGIEQVRREKTSKVRKDLWITDDRKTWSFLHQSDVRNSIILSPWSARLSIRLGCSQTSTFTYISSIRAISVSEK